jgi:hypothetical protein
VFKRFQKLIKRFSEEDQEEEDKKAAEDGD